MEKKINKFYSPLRYPGGKTKITPIIKELFYRNNLVGCDYIEPYAGGAGVALTLLFEEFVSTIQINDYDRSIYSFWYSIIQNNMKFCEKIKNTPVTVENWKKQKKIQDNKAEADFFELGFSTFFLNRTNTSGIITGGLIGGLKQQGKYKIDVRFNKVELIKKIQKIGEYKHRIKVTNKDALEILSNNFDSEFVFIDPPYVHKAKELYLNFYKKNDHENISKAILKNNSKFNWLLSYDQNDLVRSLYFSCKNKFSWNLNYGTSNRKSAEYIFLNNKLDVNGVEKFMARL